MADLVLRFYAKDNVRRRVKRENGKVRFRFSKDLANTSVECGLEGGKLLRGLANGRKRCHDNVVRYHFPSSCFMLSVI